MPCFVAMLAESTLTEDLPPLRQNVPCLPVRGALQDSGAHIEGSRGSLRRFACAPIHERGTRPGKEILRGGWWEMPEEATGRPRATDEDFQEDLRAAHEFFTRRAASGGEPLRAMGPGAAEAANCRLETTRPARWKDAVS